MKTKSIEQNILKLQCDRAGNTKGARGKCHCTIDLLFNWFGINCMMTDIFCFYLQNRLIQTSQTGGQWYSDTSHFSITWTGHFADFKLEPLEGTTEKVNKTK